MNIFKKLLIFTLFSSGLLYALSSQNGVLGAGDEVVLIPRDGHSLNVVRSYGDGANFDIEMSNNGSIYYSAYGQVDDIYLVFHNDVVEGDRIKIHVNSGSFRYSISPLKTLPKMVKKALYKKAQAESKNYLPPKKVKKPKKKRKVVKKEEPILGEFVSDIKESKRKKPKVTNKIQEEEAIDKTSTVVTYKVTPKEVPATTKEHKKVLSDSFFSNFTNIFKDLLKSLKPESKPQEPKQKKLSTNTKQISKIEPTPKPKESIVKPTDDTVLMHEATIIRRDFSKLPVEIEIFDDSELMKNAKVKKRVFPAIKKPKTPSKQKTTMPKKVTNKKPMPTPPLVAAKPEATIKEDTQADTTNLPEVTPTTQKVIIDEDRVIGANRVSPPINSYTPPPRSNDLSILPQSQIDTSYKDEYSDLNQNRELDTPKSEGNIKSEGNKIVITKVIEKQKQDKELEDPFAGRVLGKMDDRVLGGGFNPDAGVAKFGVKVTKNSRPVSAWIEVFKNGTKERVKTFYTSSTSKTKKVKLPAGVYMIRATYRTRGAKFKRTLKNIHLSEGGDITKHISFNEAKLRVVAKRGDKALYVKVEAYKSGTQKRVNYDFSDRHSGVAMLTLPAGEYDIIVYEHKNKREFNDIRVSGGVKTINADF